MEDQLTQSSRPSERIKNKFDFGDFITASVVFSMAMGAVYFPWHVYFNPSQFDRPKMVFSRFGDEQRMAVELLAHNPGVYDLAEHKFMPVNFPETGIDQTVTGSVPADTKNEQKRALAIPRISEKMALIDTDGRRALIRNEDGIYLVRPDSRLPGGSRIRMMLREGDKIRLVTNRYEIIDSPK